MQNNQVLTTHSDLIVEMRREAIKAICVLSIDDENEVEFCKLGALNPIIDCVDSTDVETQRSALSALCNLSVNGTIIFKYINLLSDNNKKEIREIGGLRPIINSLKSKDQRVVREAARALRNLSFNGLASKLIIFKQH